MKSVLKRRVVMTAQSQKIVDDLHSRIVKLEALNASLSEALAEAEKKGAEIEEAKRSERHRIFRLLWDHSKHVGAYPLGLLVQDDASVTKALPPRDLSQGGQHG